MSTTEHNGFLLGSVRLVRASQTLKLNSRKALGLLGYLAQQGRPIERDWLIELLWSEDAAPGAKGSMRTLLKNLRKQLGEAFYADRQIVALEPDAIAWDIDRFSHLAAQDDIAAWVQASTLYQGEFMRGFQLDASVEFEAWLETTRHFWFDAVNRVLRNISDYYLQHDQAEKALAYTRRWLELEPWQEKAHRQQMWLHWQLGNFDDALAQYERCALRLEHDLGIEPSPQTHELYELILKDQSSHQWQDVHEHAHSETAAAPAPENTPNTTTSTTASRVSPTPETPKTPPATTNATASLQNSAPPPITPTTAFSSTASSSTHYERAFRQRYALSSFVGRTREMTTLRHALQQHRLVTVLGLAGVGKSRLAYELLWGVASRQQPQQQNQQASTVQDSTVPNNANTAQGNHKLTADAAHDENNDPCNMLADAFANVQVMDGTTLTAAALEGYFAANSLNHPPEASLLLIDGLLEPFATVRDVLSHYLASRPGLRVLITARYPLDVAGEKRLYLTGLEPPTSGQTGQEVQQNTAQNATQNPLQNDAVRLFYERARLRVTGFSLDANNTPAVTHLCRLVSGLPRALEQLAAWLEIMPVHTLAQRLLEPADPTTVRPDWLTTLLEASWQPLDDHQRHQYAACAVLADGFNAEAAQAVAALTMPALHMLVNRSLLEVRQGRYVMPQVFRPLLLRYLETTNLATTTDNPTDDSSQHDVQHEAQQPDINQLTARHAAFYLSCLTIPGTLDAADSDNLQQAWRYVCHHPPHVDNPMAHYLTNQATPQATSPQPIAGRYDLEHPYLARYVPLLVTYYRRYGSLPTLQTLLEHTWQAVTALPATALQLHILAYLARISLQRGNSLVAYDYLEQAHARSNLSSLSLDSDELYEPTSSTPDTSFNTTLFGTEPAASSSNVTTITPNTLQPNTPQPNTPQNDPSNQTNILTPAHYPTDYSASYSASQPTHRPQLAMPQLTMPQLAMIEAMPQLAMIEAMPQLAMIEAMNAVLLARGIHALLTGDGDAAEAHFEGLLEQPSYQLPARYYLACLALQQGDTTTARQWQRALETRANTHTSSQQNTHTYPQEYAPNDTSTYTSVYTNTYTDYPSNDPDTVRDDGSNEGNFTAQRWLLAMRLELASGHLSNAQRHFVRLRTLAERTMWRNVAFQVAFYGATLHDNPLHALEQAFDIAHARADHLGALAAANAWLWCAYDTGAAMPRRCEVQNYVVNVLEHPNALPTTSLLTALLALAALNLNNNDEIAYILATHVAQHPATPFTVRQQALRYLETDVPDAPERDVLALLPAALDSLTPCA